MLGEASGAMRLTPAAKAPALRQVAGEDTLERGEQRAPLLLERGEVAAQPTEGGRAGGAAEYDGAGLFRSVPVYPPRAALEMCAHLRPSVGYRPHPRELSCGALLPLGGA